MTLSNLKKICAAYHKVATSALTVDSVDLFLVAANNVRANAEFLHNFELARCQATLTLSGSSGGALSAAVFTGGSALPAVTISATSTEQNGSWTYLGSVVNSSSVWAKAIPHVVLSLSWQGANWYVLQDSTAVNYFLGPATSTTPAGTYTGAGAFAGQTITVTYTAAGTAFFSRIKEVIAVSRTTADGFLLPLDFTRSDIVIERDRYEREMSDEWSPYNRYPSDSQLLNRGENGSVIQRGNTLYVYPVSSDSTTDFAVTLECYGQLADYTSSNLSDTEPTDFFVRYGATYMQWAIICELNYLFQTYVPRQEGVISPPEQARETAWRNLLLWDTYQVDSNATRSR